MKSYIKKRLKKVVALLLILFVAMFVFRLIYGYQIYNEPIITNIYDQVVDISSNIRKNYASKKYEMNSGVTAVSVDQKYEKIADINTLSTKFDAEEKQIRAQIKDYEGLIQFENKSGNDGQVILMMKMNSARLSSPFQRPQLTK